MASETSLPTPDESARPVVRNHRRFALKDVTLDEQAVGGATVDTWQDATGTSRWCARVLMQPRDVPESGALVGRTPDGRVLRGRVALFARGPAIRSRGPALMEWRGVGALRADVATDPP